MSDDLGTPRDARPQPDAPDPSRRARLERFFDLHAPIYDATRPLVLRGRAAAIELLEIRRGDAVLDLACGTGLNFAELRRAGAARITGVDLSRGMLEHAARRDPDARLVQGDFREIDLGERFPRAICSFAVSLLDDPVATIAAMRRHLAADAILVILDFGELQGGWRAFSPLWRGWLGAFGARTDLATLRAALAPLFTEVRFQRAAGGMAAILRLRGPRS